MPLRLFKTTVRSIEAVITYKEAGVDVSANTRWVAAIEAAMRGTYGPRVPKTRHGGFAGLFRLDYDEQLFRRNYKKPVLVGCTDGVGTKVLLAIEMKRLDSIGIDLVAMNVNDLVTCGAEPLFFLDYLAVHKLDPKHLLAVIEGIARGCREAGCALLGGETAEMPDLYHKGHLDLAGFEVPARQDVWGTGRVLGGSIAAAHTDICETCSCGVGGISGETDCDGDGAHHGRWIGGEHRPVVAGGV
jgi:phosphoribosylformylglycinamidine cyclo-ligase